MKHYFLIVILLASYAGSGYWTAHAQSAAPVKVEIKKENGQYSVHEMPPSRFAYPAGQLGDAEWDHAILRAEAFTRQCQLIEKNQAEYDRALANGWVLGQDEALRVAEAREREMADEAAARRYRDRKMGEQARAEAERIDAATSEHLPEITVATKKTGKRELTFTE